MKISIYGFTSFLAGLVAIKEGLSVDALLEPGISTQQQLAIVTSSVKIINTARRNVNQTATSMRSLIPGLTCQNAMYQVDVTDGESYTFHERFNLPEIAGTACDGYNFILEDSAKGGPKRIKTVLLFRTVTQKPCVLVAACSTTPGSYNDFESCYNNREKVKDGCLHYEDYAALVQDELAEIAVVYFPQLRTFALFGKRENTDGSTNYNEPKNDVPYLAGPSASKCPKGTVASNKLCITVG